MNRKKLIQAIESHIYEISQENNPNVRFRVRAYKALINKIRMMTGNVTEQTINRMRISEHMKKQLKQFIKASVQNYTKLTSIAGIGPKLAKSLVKRGVRSPADLRKKEYFAGLPLAAQTDLKYRPLKVIPRAYIQYIQSIFRKYNIPLAIVGSYRRGKPFSSDVDAVIRSSKSANLMDKLKNIKELNFHQPFASGPFKLALICRIKKYKKNIKLDIFISPDHEYTFTILYATGSKQFNIRMRSIAKKQGYLLNQKGLFKNGRRVLNPSHPKGLFTSEKSIFQFLKMPYVRPASRH